MADSQRVAGAAQALFEQRRGGHRLTVLPEAVRPRDLEEAYAVQDALLARLEAVGAGAPAGWKVALTSKVMQELVGVAQPCEGAILEPLVRTSPARLSHDHYVNLGVESEIAVRIARDLPAADGPYDRDSIGAAVAACMAAIEIVDDRAMDYSQLDAPLLIADNSFNAGCVLGPEVTDWQRLDLAAAAGRMRINGEIVGEGVGGDALGHPFEPLAWLANNLNRRGRMLRAGEVVLTGSIVATKWLKQGDAMTTEIDGLGEAALTVI